MTGLIYLLNDDGELVGMEETPYASEDLLQQLLAKYPSLLAGDQIDSSSPRKRTWLSSRAVSANMRAMIPPTWAAMLSRAVRRWMEMSEWV